MTQRSQWHPVNVESPAIELPTCIGIPLGFVVSELLTNAAKHGKGAITVRLRQISEDRYALSVSNDGKALPENFDPAAGKGLGMKIIRSYVQRIGGELNFGLSDYGQGASFTVLFSDRL
jgi:two-component sensor histidine kinase